MTNSLNIGYEELKGLTNFELKGLITMAMDTLEKRGDRYPTKAEIKASYEKDFKGENNYKQADYVANLY